MGNNIQISTPPESLKKDFLKHLYKCDTRQLIELRQYINNTRLNEQDTNKIYGNIEYQISIINILDREQHNLIEKIPENNHRLVSNFINDVNNDLNSFIYLLQLSNINETNYDPRKILRLNDNCTINDLKQAYRHFSLITHPDRPNGSENTFNLVNKAYNDVLKDLESKTQNRQHNDLKNNSNDYILQQNNNQKQNTELEGSFNLNEFNNIFNKTKEETANEKGYIDWLKQNNSNNTSYKSSYNQENFNKFYVENVKDESNSVVNYVIPTENNKQNINCHELGVSEVKSFTGNTNNLYYSDIIEALSNSNIANMKTNRKDYKSLDDIEKDRSNNTLKQDEINYIERQKKMDERFELQRQENIKRQDQLNFEKYDKLNAMMLQNVYQ